MTLQSVNEDIVLNAVNGDMVLQKDGVEVGRVVSGFGKTLQVVSKLITAQYSQALTAAVEVEVAGAGVFTLSITPKGNNSKFKIYVRHFGEVVSAHNCVFNILRDSIRINSQTADTYSGISMATQTYGGGADDNSTPEIVHLSTIDTTGSVAGTAIEFKVTQTHNAAQTQYTNRCIGAPVDAYEIGTSEIIIEEIGA